jgi:hypothetical protein
MSVDGDKRPTHKISLPEGNGGGALVAHSALWRCIHRRYECASERGIRWNDLEISTTLDG